MREHTWNSRLASTQHFRWYRDLRDLHALTRHWSQRLSTETETKRLPYPETLLLLRSLEAPETELKNASGQLVGHLVGHLDDTLPEDSLGRLDHVVRAVQAETLQLASQKFSAQTLGTLTETSFEAGKDCANRRWHASAVQSDTELRGNLRGVLSMTEGSPIFGRGALLSLRSLAHELQLEVLECPHTSHLAETRAQADTLCALHVEWLKGFLSALNPEIRVDYEPGSGHGGHSEKRCRLQWHLP